MKSAVTMGWQDRTAQGAFRSERVYHPEIGLLLELYYTGVAKWRQTGWSQQILLTHGWLLIENPDRG
jgi:hypothetical protein